MLLHTSSAMADPFDLSSNAPFDTEGDDSDDSDLHSVTSFAPFSSAGSTATSITSYDVSMRSDSPAPSVMSMTSSVRAQALYRQEYGRELNNYSEVYRLPADYEELHRLEQQHLMFIDVMGAKYAPPLPEVMVDDTPGERKAVLDLGCGSGNWIMDVAREFPNCDAVGVDLVPMQSLSMPPNLRSEVDDINLGLEHFYGDFDVVHTRLISSGIKDYYRVIDQISRVLRPGGLIDVAEFDFRGYDENHERFVLGTHQIGPPWWARWMTFVASAVRHSGGDLDAATHLYQWISEHPAFEDVVYREFWLPIVASPKDDPLQHKISITMKADVRAFVKSGRPLLLGTGLAEDIMDQLETGTLKELEEGRPAQYTRLQCVYARKKRE